MYCFPFLKNIIFQAHQSFESHSSTLGEIDKSARGLFYTKFNSEQLLFEPFFDRMRIFGIVKPKIECIFPFLKNIIFQTRQSFESFSSTMGEIDKSAHGLFNTKFNSEQLLFEPFSDRIRIFGIVEHQTEFKLLFHSNIFQSPGMKMLKTRFFAQ